MSFSDLELIFVSTQCFSYRVPDRIVLLPEGRIYFVELKNEQGRLSVPQKYLHKKFKRLGIHVYVPNSKAQVDEFIEEVR